MWNKLNEEKKLYVKLKYKKSHKVLPVEIVYMDTESTRES